MNIQIEATNKYYTYIITITSIVLIGVGITQFFRPTSIYSCVFLFLLIESSFFFRHQVTKIEVNENKITLTFYQYFTKHNIITELSNVQFNKVYQASYRSPSKKLTLMIIFNHKKFEVNKLDGFDEEELERFIESLPLC